MMLQLFCVRVWDDWLEDVPLLISVPACSHVQALEIAIRRLLLPLAECVLVERQDGEMVKFLGVRLDWDYTVAYEVHL